MTAVAVMAIADGTSRITGIANQRVKVKNCVCKGTESIRFNS